MKYNLSPILNILERDVPNHEVWRERLNNFFSNDNHDPVLVDEYYDILIRNPFEIGYLASKGFQIDHYTSLFSFDTIQTEKRHSFNMAYYVMRYYHRFLGKNVLTFTTDYGILNLQIKFIGINLVNSIIPNDLKLGTVLACIGNNCVPYNINLKKFKKYDTIFAANIFNSNEEAWDNWDFLLTERLQGKEVYFTTYSNTHLINHMNYDRIELVEDPINVYDPEDYANIAAGYCNRIYRIK